MSGDIVRRDRRLARTVPRSAVVDLATVMIEMPDVEAWVGEPVHACLDAREEGGPR